jgi:hypothetical protein
MKQSLSEIRQLQKMAGILGAKVKPGVIRENEYKELKEEQIKHNNLKKKYNDLVLGVNELNVLYQNLAICNDDIINNITIISKMKVRDVKKTLTEYISSFYTIDFKINNVESI